MYRPGSSLSRAKGSKQGAGAGAGSGGVSVKPVEHKMPTLEEYIKNRDWVGAIAWLENEKRLINNIQHFKLASQIIRQNLNFGWHMPISIMEIIGNDKLYNFPPIRKAI